MQLRRKLSLVAAGVVAAVVVLELALQLVAFVVWASASPPGPSAGAGRSVLCVGDSFTYGLGASDPDHAYPAVAQHEAAAAGLTDLRFVNLGWPGQDSGRVLARLPGQLATHRPALVYVLAGYNDFWRGGDVPAGAAAGGFPLEFRTWKLARMVAAALAGGAPADVPPDGGAPDGRPRTAPADAPFLGPWHAGSAFFDFRADGTIDTHEGPFDGVWSLRGDTIVVELRDRDTAVEIGWRLDAGRLVLEGGPFAAALTLEPGMPDATPLDRGRAARRAGDAARAERELRAALDVPALRFDAALELAALLVAAARTGEAMDLLRAEGPAARGAPRRLARLGDALLLAGDAAAAAELVGGALREGPVDDGVVQVAIRGALRFPDPAAFDRALADALARDDLTAEQRLGLLGLRAAIAVDATAAIDALVEVARVRSDADAFVRAVRWRADEFPRAEFVARAARLPDAERRRVVEAYDAARAVDDATGAGLGRNLRAIVAACRGAGAGVVLMTYPGGRADVAEVVHAVAAAVGVPVLDQRERFERLVAEHGRAQLFVADGHCSDAGYAAMGRAVAADAVRRLR